MFEVRTPNPHFTGERAGIKFVRGVGYCEALQARLMAQLGYEVSRHPEAEKSPQEPNVLPLQPSQPKTAAKRTRKPRGAAK